MKKKARTSPGKRRSPPNKRAFLNVPYDQRYEPLYLAFIAGLSGFGLVPQATVQIPGSERRLDRILELIHRCGISFHDLSRVELDPKPPRTPRFNMPFELGLAVAWAGISSRTHEWFVFESKPDRILKSLSDLAGTEVYVHEARPEGVLRQLANALVRNRHRPTVKELLGIYDDVAGAARQIKRDFATDTLFETRPFTELVYAARYSARQRVASLRKAR
jgi:hypothetical protein